MSRPRLSSIVLLRVLLALCVAALAFLFANLGCSSGAVCYRQTDCPSGTTCHSGQCVRNTASDAGVSDGASEESDSGTAGSTGSATAGTGGGSGSATTAGSGGV